ncbi:apolipoprotein d-like [Stylonychia lemnae]|uniref:Apolipoprotein d-like n=1 Tax=Stylonychia lemnae TaxID=5949 RepID=A0A078AB87_STYLE|nr:apolipoprotein d-like [Stylonychia lemnae]|eukprot:CDW78043.1 apolipoprotein d-like [Stylonychia lemnae]
MISRTLILTISSLTFALGNSCKAPEPQAGFTHETYSGVWYEIAKFQTAGGAFWEKDCVCTHLNVTTNEQNVFQADNICNNKVPTGKITSVVGKLIDETPNHPGRFKQQIFSFLPPVDYTVLYLGNFTNDQGEVEEYSVEYDCTEGFLTEYNYCVHFLSRKPTMSKQLLDKLIEDITKLNLNDENLDLTISQQNGCWNKSSSSTPTAVDSINMISEIIQ